MKIIEYKCEVCRDKYTNEQAVKNSMVKAIYFTGNTKFEIKPLPQECDTHICVRCLDQLKNQL